MQYINWRNLSRQDIYIRNQLKNPIISQLWKHYPDLTQALLHEKSQTTVVQDPEQKIANTVEILYADRAFPNYCPCCGETFSRINTTSHDERFCSRECRTLFRQGQITGYIQDEDLVNAYFSEFDIDQYQKSIDMPRLEFMIIYLRHLLGLVDIITPVIRLDSSSFMNYSDNNLEYIFFLFNYSLSNCDCKGLFAALHILHTEKIKKKDLSGIVDKLGLKGLTKDSILSRKYWRSSPTKSSRERAEKSAQTQMEKFMNGLQILPEVEFKNFIIQVTEHGYYDADLSEYLEAYQEPLHAINDGFSPFKTKPNFFYLRNIFRKLSILGYTMAEQSTKNQEQGY